MKPEDSPREKLTQTLRELNAAITEDARSRWEGVKTAHRRERSREVWRFRTHGDSEDRFLHVPRESIGEGRDVAARLTRQLRDARWMDRMQMGPERSFVLSPSGRLQAWPKA